VQSNSIGSEAESQYCCQNIYAIIRLNRNSRTLRFLRPLRSPTDVRSILIGIESLLPPGIAEHMVAILLPETGRIGREEFETTHPFHRFPAIKVRHDKALGNPVEGERDSGLKPNSIPV